MAGSESSTSTSHWGCRCSRAGNRRLDPFTYIATGLSRFVLGHPFAAIDIVVFLYFVVGGLGWLYLASKLKLSRVAGVFAAFTWCTEGPSADETAVSFLAHPFFEGFLDDNPVTLGRNDIGQMTVAIPAGHHELSIAYADPYLGLGLLLAGVGSSLCVLGLVLFRRRLSFL